MMKLHTASLNIIRSGQASSGAYVASPTFSQYGYSWLRDGSWTAYGMDNAGEHDSARTFYQWVGQTLSGQEARFKTVLDKCALGISLDEGDYLPTRFTVAGQIDTQQPWWNFQLDGYGAWLWGLAAHLDFTHDAALLETVRPAIALTVQYLAALWQSANYDCWEEYRDQIHTSTLAALYGGLAVVCRLDPALVPAGLPETIRAYMLQNCVAPDGYFVKSSASAAVDASLLWVAVPYRVVEVDDPRFLATLEKIEHDLHRPGGGVYRYIGDWYYGGGEWILLTAWLAWTYIELGRVDEARQLMRWIEAQATPQGELPEQVSDHMLVSDRYAEWEEKWGQVACPLLWSHAMYLVVEARLEGQL